MKPYGTAPVDVYRLRTGEREQGRRLDHVVIEWLSRALDRPLSKSLVRRWIMAGAIRRNNAALRRPGWLLVGGEALEATLRIGCIPLASDHRPASPIRVLFEDGALIAVDKPPGLPFHATADPDREHFVGWVARQIGCANLGIRQRLDRDTSGVVVFTKDAAANPGLAEQFAHHTVEKTYHAITARSGRLPPSRFRIANRLVHAGRGGGARMAQTNEGGVSAETEFRVLRVLGRALLVEARPKTGRKHQIRVHLAEAGLPILGDRVYGSNRSAQAAPRVMLHAVRLVLRHPLTGAALSIESPYPDDFAQLLSACTERSRSPRGPDPGQA